MALLSYFSGNVTWAASFKYRDYRLLWVATVFQSVGMGMEHVALGWLVLELTDSAFMVGVASAARMAPFFFLGIVNPSLVVLWGLSEHPMPLGLHPLTVGLG